MGRTPWRVSRAFRVLLACLALWLPARSGSAWVAPADPVVMLSGAAARGVASRVIHADASDEREARRRGAARVEHAPRRALSVQRREPRSLRRRSDATASRAVATPLYLLNCVLLR